MYHASLFMCLLPSNHPPTTPKKFNLLLSSTINNPTFVPSTIHLLTLTTQSRSTHYPLFTHHPASSHQLSPLPTTQPSPATKSTMHPFIHHPHPPFTKCHYTVKIPFSPTLIHHPSIHHLSTHPSFNI